MLNLNEKPLYKEAYLELLRCGIGTSRGEFDFSALSHDDWKAVCAESSKQATALICFETAAEKADAMPREVYDEWFKKSIGATASGVIETKGRKLLAQLLRENGINFVILKGASSAFYYPTPDKRSSGDVDFYVDSDNLERTRELLSDNGYEMEPDMNDVHYTFKKNELTFELHKTFSGLPENKVKDAFLDELSDIIDKSEQISEELIKPCDYHHGIIIFLHTLHHMLSTGIGARQLCDWACFVNKTKNESFWQDKMLPLLKRTGLLKFESALTETCVFYLGVESPEWHTPSSDELRDLVFNEIYAAGNFGRKHKRESSSSIMVTKNSRKLTFFGKIKQLLKSLNDTNKKAYPVLNKAPWLYPFIMVYRVLRYIVLVIRGERVSLSAASKYASERNSVTVQFGLYETDENEKRN